MRWIIVLVAALVFVACGTESEADRTQRLATDQLTAEAQRQVGMPNIVNFQERKLMKMIMELRDKENLVTYAYITTWDGKLVYIGQCVGFGLPYSVQFTNPEKLAWPAHHNSATTPQPDPNGLFMPDGLSATWLMMLDPETKEVRPVYVEPQIIVSPFPLRSMTAEK